MKYVLDLESFSLVLRPRQHDTEVIQIERSPYTVAEGLRVADQLRTLLPEDTMAWSEAAAMAFVFLFREHDFALYSNGRWLVVDSNNQTQFTFHRNDKGNQQAGELTDIGDVKPSSSCFDLLEQVQPSAKRYVVDELISSSDPKNSDFLSQKQAMDYLYQGGVFGRFDQ